MPTSQFAQRTTRSYSNKEIMQIWSDEKFPLAPRSCPGNARHIYECTDLKLAVVCRWIHVDIDNGYIQNSWYFDWK
jgi:hypothetical protein